MATEIKLPALKENVDTVEVDTVNVHEGDTVKKDQPLLVVLAEKATLEVSSPLTGRVAKVLVKSGDEIKVGQPYCVIEEGAGKDGDDSGGSPASRTEEARPSKGPEEREVKKSVPAETPNHVAKAPRPATADKSRTVSAPNGDKAVPAGPATRRLARELGVDLSQVPGSGREGRVTEEDVKAYVRQLASGTAAPAAPAGLGAQAPPLPKFEDWGPVDRQRLEPIRKQTAKQMSLAWSLIPHVTQHDLADITELDAFRRQQEGRGPKLTVTAFALKASAIALRQFPQFNASLDLAGGQLVVKKYYHVGVAVDTDHGLLVPVLRDVDRKSVQELAQELTDIAERARQKKLPSEEMRGGTFTITNLGGVGGTGFTPIVNWPEVAILGLSRARQQPVVRDGQIVPRLLLPLSLSYDHRVIDGAAAARFTRRLAEMLENPLVMLLHA